MNFSISRLVMNYHYLYLRLLKLVIVCFQHLFAFVNLAMMTFLRASSVAIMVVKSMCMY